MEFIKVTSKSHNQVNAEVRCEFCGNVEVIYGFDTDEWYDSIKGMTCLKCRKKTEVKSERRN